MDTKEKFLIIIVFFEGKLYNITINPKKTFKFLLMKIASELEIEEFEKIRENYFFSNRNTNINIVEETEILGNIFKDEIKNSNFHEVFIRIKLEDKKYLKPEIIPISKDEVEIFRNELKKKIDILETENKFSHDLIGKFFKNMIEDKYSIFLNLINQKREIAFESKNYSFMLFEKIRNLYKDETIKDDFIRDSNILENYKNEIRRYTYLDSEKFIKFLEKVEDKMNDLINFVSSINS